MLPIAFAESLSLIDIEVLLNEWNTQLTIVQAKLDAFTIEATHHGWGFCLYDSFVICHFKAQIMVLHNKIYQTEQSLIQMVIFIEAIQQHLVPMVEGHDVRVIEILNSFFACDTWAESFKYFHSLSIAEREAINELFKLAFDLSEGLKDCNSQAQFNNYYNSLSFRDKWILDKLRKRQF
jgi:hypothetical protein